MRAELRLTNMLKKGPFVFLSDLSRHYPSTNATVYTYAAEIVKQGCM